MSHYTGDANPNWRKYPAAELLALYGRRWEQEIFYKELKVDMRSTPLLQSHTPLTAMQEVAALILAYAVLVDSRLRPCALGLCVKYSPVSLPEKDLLARCRQGDPDAWDELFDRHYAPAGRFIFQLGSDFSAEDVEEICQETFLSVIKNLNSFHGDSQFQTWLFRIAANKARDYRERRHAAKRGSGHTPISLQAEDPETGQTIDPPSPAPAPDLELIDAEKLSLVRAALDGLDQPCREIIELRYFGDLSYEEISSTLRLNAKTVSSRLSKCLDRLESIARGVFSSEKSGAFPSNL